MQVSPTSWTDASVAEEVTFAARTRFGSLLTDLKSLYFTGQISQDATNTSSKVVLTHSVEAKFHLLKGVDQCLRQAGTARVKRGMAEMLKGGVIMDVVNVEQAKIAEDAGAVCRDGA